MDEMKSEYRSSRHPGEVGPPQRLSQPSKVDQELEFFWARILELGVSALEELDLIPDLSEEDRRNMRTELRRLHTAAAVVAEARRRSGLDPSSPLHSGNESRLP